jgi:hypothetical protein
MVESLPDLLRVKLAWDLEGLMDKAGALALRLVSCRRITFLLLAMIVARWNKKGKST